MIFDKQIRVLNVGSPGYYRGIDLEYNVHEMPVVVSEEIIRNRVCIDMYVVSFGGILKVFPIVLN